MAGLYVHIPFCRSKCAYCDFFSSPKADTAALYVQALLNEATLRRYEISEPFSTLYIGGGTPSLLPDDLLASLIKGLTNLYNPYGKWIEATIEANPEDITAEKLDFYRSLGVNRVSIGVQSFNDNLLRAVGREHSASDARKALETLTNCSVNFNADFIYGLPSESLVQWQAELDDILTYAPPHVSAYLLSYEPGTKLYVRMRRGLIDECSEQLAESMYALLCEKLTTKYNHYEISNFARPGCEAVHNSSYWNNTPYIGLGVSAHSFDGSLRRYNPLNINKYISEVNVGKVFTNVEVETDVNRLNDYVITSLRTSSGLDLQLIKQRFNGKLGQMLEQNVTTYLKTMNLYANSTKNTFACPIETTPSGNLRISEKYWLQADAILRELILDSDSI